MAPSTMSLARALTRRTKRSLSHTSHTPNRESSVRYAAGTIKRELISLPTELISTTNVDALNAPDINTLNSSSSSVTSGSDSDFTSISRGFIDSPVTTPEPSSTESSPISHDPKNTISFFDTLPQRAATTAGNRPSSSSSSLGAPAIPKRAPSHSKRAHQELARTRSLSRMSPPPLTLTGPAATRNSTDTFGGANDLSHPFGKELAQVNEVAEEFGFSAARLVEEEQDLLSKGLQKFGVNDYLEEIQELYGGVFEDRLGFMANPWI